MIVIIVDIENLQLSPKKLYNDFKSSWPVQQVLSLVQYTTFIIWSDPLSVIFVSEKL